MTIPEIMGLRTYEQFMRALDSLVVNGQVPAGDIPNAVLAKARATLSPEEFNSLLQRPDADYLRGLDEIHRNNVDELQRNQNLRSTTSQPLASQVPAVRDIDKRRITFAKSKAPSPTGTASDQALLKTLETLGDDPDARVYDKPNTHIGVAYGPQFNQGVADGPKDISPFAIRPIESTFTETPLDAIAPPTATAESLASVQSPVGVPNVFTLPKIPNPMHAQVPRFTITPPAPTITGPTVDDTEALIEELTQGGDLGGVGAGMPLTPSSSPSSAVPTSTPTGIPKSASDLLKELSMSEDMPASNALRKRAARSMPNAQAISKPDMPDLADMYVRKQRTLDAASAPKVVDDDLSDILGDVLDDTPINGTAAPSGPLNVTFGKGRARNPIGTGVASDLGDIEFPTGATATPQGGIKGFFENMFRRGAGTPKSAAATSASVPKTGGLFAPGFGERMKTGFANLTNPQFDWNGATGLKAWGKNIGGLTSAAQGLYGAYRFADALSDTNKAKNASDDIESDILTAAASNPMAAYDLTADQKRLLGELKRGSYDQASLKDLDWEAGLSGALKGGVGGFLSGGALGATVGALAEGLPAAMQGRTAAQERKNAELEALYASLSESDARYRDAKRQKAMQLYY